MVSCFVVVLSVIVVGSHGKGWNTGAGVGAVVGGLRAIKLETRLWV